MKIMCDYFEAKSKSNPLFIPEYKASKEVNRMIRTYDKPTDVEFNKIIDLIKDVDKVPHQNGIQWFDYKIHLNATLRKNGFESNIL